MASLKELLENIPDQSAAELLVLDAWQEEFYGQFKARRRMTLGAVMGLGKTPPSLRILNEGQFETMLIVVTKRALYGWVRMMRQWFPELLKSFTFITDQKAFERQTIWASKPQRVITTYGNFVRDFEGIPRKSYDIFMADECHKYIRSHKTKTFKCFNRIHSIWLLLITGSPVSRGSHQWWTYLHLCNRHLFSSYWRFVHTFCQTFEGPWGMEIVGPKNVQAFQQTLSQFAYLVTKESLGLKRKRRVFIDVEMTPAQQKAYEQARDELIMEIDNGLVAIPNPMAMTLKLRQILICPAMLNPILGNGGAMDSILEELEDLEPESGERHCVIFTPFRAAVDRVASEITRLKLGHVTTLMGGITLDEMIDRLSVWKKNKGIAVCTIKYAESFDMETTDKAFFLGYEYNPEENWQAEDRLDRRNNLHPALRMFYLRYPGTYDDDGISNVIQKSANLNAIYSNINSLRKALMIGRTSKGTPK